MKREDFIAQITDIVSNYIEYYVGKGDDLQIRVNPLSLMTELVDSHSRMSDIAFSDEAVESAAAADDPMVADAADRQARQDPDFYAIDALVTTDSSGRRHPDAKAIETLAKTYFGKGATNNS